MSLVKWMPSGRSRARSALGLGTTNCVEADGAGRRELGAATCSSSSLKRSMVPGVAGGVGRHGSAQPDDGDAPLGPEGVRGAAARRGPGRRSPGRRRLATVLSPGSRRSTISHMPVWMTATSIGWVATAAAQLVPRSPQNSASSNVSPRNRRSPSWSTPHPTRAVVHHHRGAARTVRRTRSARNRCGRRSSHRTRRSAAAGGERASSGAPSSPVRERPSRVPGSPWSRAR